MIKPLLNFLFGKDALIFNKKGKVEHDLGPKKWSEWHNRFDKNPDYNFTKHQGRKDKKVQ